MSNKLSKLKKHILDDAFDKRQQYVVEQQKLDTYRAHAAAQDKLIEAEFFAKKLHEKYAESISESDKISANDLDASASQRSVAAHDIHDLAKKVGKAEMEKIYRYYLTDVLLDITQIYGYQPDFEIH